jgi:SAM-dependent methyltransferase
MDDALELTSRTEATHFWFRGFRHFVRPIIEEIAAARGGLRLIDCGCGTGHNLPFLERYGRTFGFDLTPAGLAHARTRGVPIARADISRIPFLSGTFDVVTSFDVLQYVEDDGVVMKEFVRLLRPGGSVVITAAAMEILRGGHAAFWPEVRRYSPERLRRIAEDAGLQVRRTSYLFGSLFPMVLAARLASRTSGPGPSGPGAPGPSSRPANDWEMSVPPAPINASLTWLLAAEAALSRHVPMPFGSSLLLVARKP